MFGVATKQKWHLSGLPFAAAVHEHGALKTFIDPLY